MVLLWESASVADIHFVMVWLTMESLHMSATVPKLLLLIIPQYHNSNRVHLLWHNIHIQITESYDMITEWVEIYGEQNLKKNSLDLICYNFTCHFAHLYIIIIPTFFSICGWANLMYYLSSDQSNENKRHHLCLSAVTHSVKRYLNQISVKTFSTNLVYNLGFRLWLLLERKT